MSDLPATPGPARDRGAAEHERALLSAVLLDGDPQRCRATLAATDPACFADPDRAATWAQTRRVMATDPPPPGGPELVKAVHAEGAGDPRGLSFEALADVTGAGSSGASDYYGARVRDAHLRREATRGFDDAEIERIGDKPTAEVIAERLADFRVLAARAAGPAPLRRAMSARKVTGDRPERLLWCAGKNGALLSHGGVLVLAGEGGVAKSPLALSVALGFAARDGYGDLQGGLFGGAGGAVLVASYEDWAAVSADRLRRLAAAWWPAPNQTGDVALDRVHLLDLAGAPLFGPVAPGDGAALYNARPGPLDGWSALWEEAERIDARLVVIDPALAAYAGNANEAAPVRDFMSALAERARALRCGVLLIAHSRKDARNAKQPDPFDPGNVAGSSHWTDAARGVLTLTWDKEPGARVLAVSKANYGPARLLVTVDPVRSPHGEIVGFTNGAGAAWDTKRDTEATAAPNGATGRVVGA